MFCIITNTYFENSWYSKALNMGFSTHEIINISSAGQWKCTVRLWGMMQRLLKKLKIKLPYNPAIPLLGIYTEETRIERDTCTPEFITALFTIARTWKQPGCPSADAWIRKLWYKYTMQYYSAIKEKCIWVSSNEVDETGAYYTEWSKSERKAPIHYINA